MKKYLFIVIMLVLFLFFIFLFGLDNIVNANIKNLIDNIMYESQNEPSITVTLKNINTDNYIIDLFVYDKDGSNYNDKVYYNGSGLTSEEINILHSLNYDGWISEGTRWYSFCLFADCSGNKLNKHTFSYFGTPDTYKVFVWNKNTGVIKLSNAINRTEFTSNISIDTAEMTIQKSSSIKLIIYNILKVEILTLIIEIFIAVIMKLKHLKVIILTNLCTNLIFQILLVISPISYYITFSILEILVMIVEYIVYHKFIKDTSNKKLISYTIIANVMSGIAIPLIISKARRFVIAIKEMYY